MNNNEHLGYPNSRLSERFGLVPPCSDNRGWTVYAKEAHKVRVKASDLCQVTRGTCKIYTGKEDGSADGLNLGEKVVLNCLKICSTRATMHISTT